MLIAFINRETLQVTRQCSTEGKDIIMNYLTLGEKIYPSNDKYLGAAIYQSFSIVDTVPLSTVANRKIGKNKKAGQRFLNTEI